ncbi:SDR family oxidoreductase [Rhizobium sp. KVB221]|uniref:SDR family oxidoreductase n=1 Tax=Rhizobium setariae TaxID=2801340 RepID=A0A937CRC9_9HYPH|nr:SDR family oxidoreductase [Rhizobium setariae]
MLITGGHRGLGLALSRQFFRDGWRVIAAGRRDKSAEAGIEALALDLADERSILRAAASLAGRPVDILVHNAAIRGAEDGLASVKTGDFLDTMQVNALAPLLLTRALLPNLARGHRKVVAMISSRAGSNAEGHIDNDDGDYAYRLSKAALNMATTKLAHDLKPDDVAVMAFHPGWIRTDMGGEHAELETGESAEGLKRLLENATLADTATFRTHDGLNVGW